MSINYFFEKIKSNKALLITAALAAIGIILILVSGKSSNSRTGSANYDDFNFEKYESALEKRLEEKINKIDGVSSADVIILVETSYIYDSINSGSYSELFGDSSENGRISESAPRIRGVAVICSGGAQAKIKKDITEMLSALLGLPTNKIWVGSK